jgi:hypothetical protein
MYCFFFFLFCFLLLICVICLQLNVIARNLRAAHLSAQSSSSVAHAATAVVEGIAAGMSGGQQTRYSLGHTAATADYSHNRSSETDGGGGDFLGNSYRDMKRYDEKPASATATAAAGNNVSMQSKIDQLREEKDRLVRELYDDSNSYKSEH